MRISLARKPFRRNALARSLKFEALEERAVPANNIAIVSQVTPNSGIQIQHTGSTTTIRTDDPNAQLSLATIEAELSDPTVQTVVVTTDVKGNGNNGNQAGTISWDAAIAGSLDFTGFATGKTLIFETVAGTNATGHITLSGVKFLNGGTGDQISLQFNSSATNGDIQFLPDANDELVATSAEAVKDLTIDAGTGDFSFQDFNLGIGAGDVTGTISIVAHDVTIAYQAGMTSFGPISIAASGDVTLGVQTGLFAARDLNITATGAIATTDSSLTADGGVLSLTGASVSIDTTVLTSPGGLIVNGTNSITFTGSGGDVQGDIALTGGTVSLTDVNLPAIGAADDITIAGTSLTFVNAGMQGDGNVTLTGMSGAMTDVTLIAGKAISWAGPVTLQGTVELRAAGAISVLNSINGAADLIVSSGTTATFAGDVGIGGTLTSFALVQGYADLGTHSLSATNVVIGGVANPIEATLGLTGTITGDVLVNLTGNLAPGGLGTIGTVTVVGNVTFDGGDFAVDFGPAAAADKLVTINASVTINNGSHLGGGLGSGQLTGSDVVLIEALGGSQSGEFANAPQGDPVLVGTDVITASYLVPNQVRVSPYIPPGGISGTVSGSEADGTLYKATLTGGGLLLSGLDSNNRLFLVARNTTLLSKLTITTTANASDEVVTFDGGILISGDLALLSAPKVNIGTQLRASKWVGAATFRDFLDVPGSSGIQLGGAVAQLTRITARNIFGSVQTGSTLSLLKVANLLGGPAFVPTNYVVSAPAIRMITAKSGSFHVASSGRVSTVKIATDFSGDITAGSVGTVSARAWNGDVTSIGAIDSIRTTSTYLGAVDAASIGKFEAVGGGATLKVAGAIGSIVGKGEDGLFLEVDAGKVGIVRVDGAISGDAIPDGPDWNVVGGITSLTAGSIIDLDVRAQFLGATLVKGHAAAALSADVTRSTFTLTGNDATLAKYGIKSFTAKGNVRDSRFNVQDGNVGPFTVGRFHNSQLYLNYTPDLGGDFTLGSFGQTKYKLTSFKTTALPVLDPANPLQWAFVNSEVCADSIGTVTLSGLQTDNGGTGFGIKVRSAGAIVVVAKADVTNDPDLPPGSNLTPDKQSPYVALAGDFFFLDV